MSASIATKFDYCNTMYFKISQTSVPPASAEYFSRLAGASKQKHISPYWYPCTASRYVLESILKITLSI